MLLLQLDGIFLFLDFVWSKYPWTDFLLLVPGANLQELADRLAFGPWCLFADATQKMRLIWSTADALLGHEYLAVLLAEAILWRISIAQLECRHAVLRRLLLLKSQTNLANFSCVSHDWLLLRNRIIEQRHLKKNQPWTEAPASETAASETAASETAASHKRPGGGCRAFLSNWFRNKFGTMAEGHARYKEIVEEDGPELAHWLKIGREGTIAANHGGSAFGGKAAHEPTSKVESQKCVEVQHPLMHHTIRVVMHTHNSHPTTLHARYRHITHRAQRTHRHTTLYVFHSCRISAVSVCHPYCTCAHDPLAFCLSAR
jgi:hypothetical protein